jgi:hypothetical protein
LVVALIEVLRAGESIEFGRSVSCRNPGTVGNRVPSMLTC